MKGGWQIIIVGYVKTYKIKFNFCYSKVQRLLSYDITHDEKENIF